MAKKTRINESNRYDPFTSRGTAMDDAPIVPPNASPAEDAVLALNVAKMLAADALLDEAKADYKSIKDHVSGKGVNLAAYGLARKIVKSGKVAEHIALFADTLIILKILGRPVSSDQLVLFESESSLTPLDERAATEGRYAGIMGIGEDANPYGIDSTAGQAWLNAWYGGKDEHNLIISLEPKPGSELIKGDDGEDDAGDTDEDPFEQDEAA
jgi:ribosome modulation factor